MYLKMIYAFSSVSIEDGEDFKRKEEESQKCKDEVLVLWTDFFKPQHLEAYPDLHTTFWMAAKLCSACKVEVSEQHAQELMDAVEEIHNMFWATKGRDVSWVRAS